VEVPVVTFAPEPTTEPDPPLPEGEVIALPAEPPSTAEDSFWQTPSLSKLTTRTKSPYFSPNNAIAPDAFASSIDITFVVLTKFILIQEFNWS
jgi:hypothetical protein